MHKPTVRAKISARSSEDLRSSLGEERESQLHEREGQDQVAHFVFRFGHLQDRLNGLLADSKYCSDSVRVFAILALVTACSDGMRRYQAIYQCAELIQTVRL
jgi:hypothetical protein